MGHAFAYPSDEEKKERPHHWRYWMSLPPRGRIENGRLDREFAHTNKLEKELADDDYRNRDTWELYEEAVNEMINRTSMEYAPWLLIEANDLNFMRELGCYQNSVGPMPRHSIKVMKQAVFWAEN